MRGGWEIEKETDVDAESVQFCPCLLEYGSKSRLVRYLHKSNLKTRRSLKCRVESIGFPRIFHVQQIKVSKAH